MTDVRSNQASTSTSQVTPTPSPRGATSTSSSSGRSLETPQGRTTIEDPVVAKIVDIATREVDGVHDLTPLGAGSAISSFASSVTSRVTGGGDQRGQDVNVEVGQREAAVDLGMVVNYGYNIPQVAETVRRNIINRVSGMTGLVVKEVNITVTDLFFPEDQARRQQQQVAQAAAQQPRVQ